MNHQIIRSEKNEAEVKFEKKIAYYKACFTPSENTLKLIDKLYDTWKNEIVKRMST